MFPFVVFLLFFKLFADGLVLTDLDVPEEVILGGDAVLTCRFRLGAETLYSVKWYKDDNEYFRFMPYGKPQMKVFAQQGIAIDESQSDMHKAVLTSVTGNYSGTHKCEVSTEGPAFETAVASANLTVVAFPDRDPLILLEKYYFRLNEDIIANCTSGKSYPPTDLNWFINRVKTSRECQVKYHVIPVGRGLYRTWSQVKFNSGLTPGKIALTCVGSISKVLPAVKGSAFLSIHEPLVINSRLSADLPYNSISFNRGCSRWMVLLSVLMTFCFLLSGGQEGVFE